MLSWNSALRPWVVVIGVALASSGCDLRHPVIGSAKDLTRTVVQDPGVQSSFVRGREKAMGTDARKLIVRQNLMEQGTMWDSPATRPGMVHLLVHGRDVAMNNPQARSALLRQNLRDQSLMWSDPSLSRAMTRFAVQGRAAAIQDPATAGALLQQNLREQRSALANADIATGMSDVSTRLTQHAMQVPEQAKRMRHMTMSVMEGISRDPVERRRLLTLLSSLMEDPAMKSKLLSMMKAMLASSGSGSSGGSGGSSASLPAKGSATQSPESSGPPPGS